MAQTGAFTGFPREAFRFLENLAAHNNLEWFDAHRGEWEEFLLHPAKALIAVLQAPLQELSPGIHVDPRVGGSLFSIRRDPHLSKDERPFREHLDFWFWHGAHRAPVSALFMRMTATRLALGAGCHIFEKDALERFRRLMSQEAEADRLAVLTARLEHHGHQIEGVSHVGTANGQGTTSTAQARFLRHSGLWAIHDELLPSVVGTPDLADHCLSHWKHMQPLHAWLLDHLGD